MTVFNVFQDRRCFDFGTPHTSVRDIPARLWGLGLLIFGVVGLASCAGPQPQTVCPGYVHYQHADNQALLAELQGAGSAGFPLPQTHRYLRDYGKQRASLRVICGGNQ